MIHEKGFVLGVDVGWAKDAKTTGACILEWTAADVMVKPIKLSTDDWNGLQRLLPGGPILGLAVDGPLRGAIDEIGEYRDAELFLTRRIAKHIGKPGQSNSGNGRKLNAAANSVARRILSTGNIAPAVHLARIHERAIAEAFPTSFLGVMLDEGPAPAHGARSDAYFHHLLGPNANRPPQLSEDRLLGLIMRLLPGRKLASHHLGAIHDHEERAAIVCAMTALCVVARKYVAVGDPKNGYIILPPQADHGEPGFQPWALNLIKSNCPKENETAIIIE